MGVFLHYFLKDIKMRFFSILSLLCLSSLLVSQGEGSVTVATVAAVVTTGSTLIGLYRSYNMNGCWPRNIDDSHKLVLNSWYMTRASAGAAIRDTLKKNPAKTLCEKVTGTTRYKNVVQVTMKVLIVVEEGMRSSGILATTSLVS